MWNHQTQVDIYLKTQAGVIRWPAVLLLDGVTGGPPVIGQGRPPPPAASWYPVQMSLYVMINWFISSAINAKWREGHIFCML